MKETKMPIYKCAICHNEYDTIERRNACESKCIVAAKEAAKKAEEAKKQADKEARKKEVEQAFKTAFDLSKKYAKDYGECMLYGLLSDEDIDNIWPSRLMHDLFF